MKQTEANYNNQNELFLKATITSVCLEIYKYLKTHSNNRFTVKLATGKEKGLICHNKSFPASEFDHELAQIIREYRIKKYGKD